MLIQILISILLGLIAGTITGLLPGIHINLVGAFLVALSSSLLSRVNSVYLLVFITTMAIAHTFIDFIPSIFLGCPDEGTELSILPGHQLLKESKGYEAIYLTAIGGLTALFILIVVSFPLTLLIPKIYNSIIFLIPYLLIIISFFMIFSEKKKFSALLAFSLSGALGLIALNLGLKEPLLPLLTGLFGGSSMILSIQQKTSIPKQETGLKPKAKILRPLFGGIAASLICGFLPGLGSGEAAVIGNQISKTDTKGFLVLLGIINTLVMGLAFIAFYTISKTRTGIVVSVQELLGNLELKEFILVIGIIFISGILSFFLTLFLARFFSNIIDKISYTILSWTILLLVSAVVLIFSGALGFVVFALSTLTGLYCINSLSVKRTNMMACLLLPTIFLYLF